jgi:protein-S-isoprenylcysteine O-methyltransferase Ste14
VNKLAVKTSLGFANLMVILAIVLFAPAWTLDFWQAWVYLFIFFLSSFLITAFLWKKDPALLERRLQAGPVAEKRITQKLIQAFASLAFLGILVLPSLDHRFSGSHIPVACVVLGEILVALGFWIVFLVYRENSFASATIAVASDQTVISSGPYAHIRHPMYAGALVMLLGTPLALGSWLGLLMFVPMLLVIVLRLLDEERFLHKSLAGYGAYCLRVRFRLVPFVW